ncbi:MAG TPA: matrixin family metalloprotease [Acidimicrobiales bacterium]|nr:matrixin family metalloprotease [Acidimicrobiales bacterium]
MGLSVSLLDSELTVDPGGFVRTEVRIRNSGSRTARVRLRVAGPAATWSWVVPPEQDVAAGAESVMTLGFRVQRTSIPAAGELAFEVVATPAIGHDSESGARERIAEALVGRAAGSLTVTPFREVIVELDPPDTRTGVPTDHVVVVDNRGNTPMVTTLEPRGDAAVEMVFGSTEVETSPGERHPVPVRVRPRSQPLLRPRSLPFAVAATSGDGDPVTLSGELEHPARLSPPTAVAVVVAVLVIAAGLRFSVLAPDDAPATDVAAADNAASAGTAERAASSDLSSGHGPSGGHGGCAADGHRDTRATGLTPDQIPSLPPDYAFFQVASDNCSPVRWNPCKPIHYVINPANAPATGVADTREAFKRLAAATGMTYVDDGLTDEDSQGDRAYQPDRYGDVWAPILVHWMSNSRAQGDIQVIGGGFPTQVGDVYVTGNLFLNPNVVTNTETRSTVAGGFDDGSVGIGAIGPEGVTWGRVILHELAHITGLGHVSVPSNLMYPETSDQTGAAGFSQDDLAGMKLLGRDAGCLETPKPGPLPDPRTARRP